MSQKSTHNSNPKRRPPSENAENGKQDADWGFDPDEADPAIEKKLAVALVVCLLAGFGFVFYQKFRLLRNDEVQQASTREQAQPIEAPDAGAVDPGSDDESIALRTATPAAATPSDVPPNSTQIESPFYEREQADSSPSESDETWSLTQAEVTHQSASPSPPAELPPLPENSNGGGFDPFAGPDTDEAAETTRTPSGKQQTAPDEPPMLVWQDDTAVPSPASQSNPPPDSLPQSSPQPLPRQSATPADPFAFDDEPTSQPSDLDHDTSVATNPRTNDEPQVLIFGAASEPSEQHESGEASPTMKSGEVPPQSEPAAFEKLDAVDQPTPPSPDASEFDPFAGTAPIDESATAAPADSSSVPSSRSSDATTGDTESEEMFAPFPTSDTTPPAQTETSIDVANEPAGDLDSADDPFSFPPSRSGPPPQKDPLNNEPALEPLPAAEKPSPAESSATPTWPSGGSPRLPEVIESPAPFASPDAGEDTAPRQSHPPQITIEPASDEPTTSFPVTTDTSSATTAPNPFSFDDGTSRPIISSTRDAQRVVGEREITVTPSDTFWSISEREYGNSRYFTALARYNRDRVARPERLQSGMKIIIPPPEVLEVRFPELFWPTSQGPPTISPMSGASSPAPPQSGLFFDEVQRPHFRVGENDTLSSIARQHLGRESRWTEIYDLNKDQLKSPSSLRIGTELKLPPDASEVRVSPADGFDR